jgi:hypothetical protein
MRGVHGFGEKGGRPRNRHDSGIQDDALLSPDGAASRSLSFDVSRRSLSFDVKVELVAEPVALV